MGRRAIISYSVYLYQAIKRKHYREAIRKKAKGVVIYTVRVDFIGESLKNIEDEIDTPDAKLNVEDKRCKKKSLFHQQRQ